MTKRRNAKITDEPVSLLILEGDTEQIFYPILRDKFLQKARIELCNIKGRSNINKNVLSEILKYRYNNRHDLVRAYCCVDTERGKCTAIALDLECVREKARERNMSQVLSIDAILADPDIESWFFYDIAGIYSFLRARTSRRNIQRYGNPSTLCKKDLQQLFQRFEKVYLPGKRATNFINHLDIKKIVFMCRELREGIELIQSQAKNLTNHLFPHKNVGDR